MSAVMRSDLYVNVCSLEHSAAEAQIPLLPISVFTHTAYCMLVDVVSLRHLPDCG